MNWPELPADQLIRACTTSARSGAWEEFMRRYLSVITAAAIRVARHWGDGGANEVDDVATVLNSVFGDERQSLVSFFRLRLVSTNAMKNFVEITDQSLSFEL